MWLRYTRSGHLFISAGDDCNKIVDAMLITNYSEDFCIADDFDPGFVARLMEAGFLVMSANIAREGDEPDYLLFPKLHIERSALLFENLHVKKSIRRLLDRRSSEQNHWELRPDVDFTKIVDRCVEKHGADWLTPPLVECIKKIRDDALAAKLPELAAQLPAKPYPASFALYHNGELAAGEFGVICGKVYTSYSGFYEKDNAGTVQLILTARYLQEQGFSFFDLGMPMDYKTDLGAVDIDAQEFVRLFRGLRELSELSKL